MISSDRREFIRKVTALTGCSLLSVYELLDMRLANANWNAESFQPTSMGEVLKKVLKGKPIVDSKKISVKIADSADNKTPLPITIETELKDILSISILVEQNPVPLVATFELSPLLVPVVSTRLKLMHSSFVFVLVETEKVVYGIKHKVTISDSSCGA